MSVIYRLNKMRNIGTLWKHSLAILNLALVVSSFLISDGVVLTTDNGLVRGTLSTKDGEKIYQFFKIPYAEPPIFDLRFKKPVTKSNWTGILDATKHGPICPQVTKSYSVSEDCLFLNIYVPGEIDPNSKKAVMVWIHGGGYFAGSGNKYDGSYLALNGDLIVVTINYRLGVLGFLSTEDSVAEGNYGLWDQVKALEWVNQNIVTFGGDPYNITVFGESAGGYSVGLLTMLPATKGLFQRVITESGVGLSPRAITHDARNTAISIAKDLSCLSFNSNISKTENMSSAVKCLRGKTINELVNSGTKLIYRDYEFPKFFIRFGPVVDGDLIPDTPSDLLERNTSGAYELFMSRDIMSGSNNGDGGLIVRYFLPKPYFDISKGIPTSLFCSRIVNAVARDYFNANSSVSDALCIKYTATNFTLIAQAQKSVDFFGDFLFAEPTVKVLDIHRQSSRQSFQYLFSHKPQYSSNMPSWFQRANHGNDVQFVFGIKQSHSNASIDEIQLSNQIMTYWTNFAKFGNPNGQGLQQKLQWPSYKINNSYINLDITSTVGSNLYQDRIDFWIHNIPIPL